MRSHRGFTLIELMIAVAIVAILAAIALPSYTEYVRRGKITEAVSQLSGMRVKMEQHFQDRRSYAVGGACQPAANPPTTVAPRPDNTANFDYTCATAANTYTVTATGKGAVLGFTYTLNQANQRTSSFPAASGWKASATCWVIRKDGAC